MEVYACYLKDKEELNNSTSGGAFYGFAKKIIENGGVVFGATEDDEGYVYHTCAQSLEELENLRQSKYVQSRILDTYTKIKQLLVDNQLVLFSGTPCQVAGLRSFLQVGYKQLYCVEVICHGVPSQKEFNLYKKELAPNKRINGYLFRSKCLGWDNMHIQYSIDNTVNVVKSQEDDFFYAFDNKYNLRRSCYDCKFKGENSDADITMGDYWGIKQQHPDFYNNMGVSVVVVRNEKGKNLFKLCIDEFNYIESSYEKALYNNSALQYGYVNTKKRTKYFELYNQGYNRNEIIKLLEKEDYNYNFTIVGSYSSRLVVNKIRERNPVLKIRNHFMDSTLASICSNEILTIDDNEIMCSNEFRKQLVLSDLHKNFKSLDADFEENDWLVIDLLEERHDNLLFNNTIITDSESFQECDIQIDAQRISFFDMSISMWKDYCMKFIRLIKQKYRLDHVILNCAYMAELHGTKDGVIPFKNIEYIRKFNHRLKECYQFIQDNLKGIICIDNFNVNVEYCSDLFEYGCEPIYYNMHKYLSDSEMIERIVLKGERDG